MTSPFGAGTRMHEPPSTPPEPAPPPVEASAVVPAGTDAGWWGPNGGSMVAAPFPVPSRPLALRPITLPELRAALRATEPAAVMVTSRVMDRLLRATSKVSTLLWAAPHRHSCVVDRHVLFRHVEQDELDLEPEHLLPPTVLVLVRPTAEELGARGRVAVLLEYWRLLFHASVHQALEHPGPDGGLTADDVLQRIGLVGAAEFAEIRRVLAEENQLPAGADDRAAWVEFAAYYLELRYFAPGRLPSTFPAVRDYEAVDRLLARDVDAERLFVRTRLPGAPAPTAPAEVANDESHEFYRRLLRQSERAAAAGNVVAAAILRTRAARVAPDELTTASRDEARAELFRLTARLRAALQFDEAEELAWREHLAALLDKADQGNFPVEAALLHDLQNVCVDHEREVYALDLVEWALSAGRRPIKRPLPSQRPVRITRHLHGALQRSPKVRLARDARQRLTVLLQQAVRRSEERLRDRFRPVLTDALLDVGLRPAGLAEQAAFNNVVEELLDRITGYGFLTFGDLRDTLSRNQLKLPDLNDPQQFVRGDQLLRLDRRLSMQLDGVYRPSEFYVRWLERFTSINFGTEAGRFVTRNVTVPFGGAFLLYEGVLHLWHKGLHYAGHEPEYELARPAEVGIVLALGLFLLGLIQSEAMRKGMAEFAVRAGRLARHALIDMPARLMRVDALRGFFKSFPFQLFYVYLFKPSLVTGLLWLLVPDAFNTFLAAAGIFLAVSFLLNSRLGEAASEAVTQSLVGFYDLLRAGLLPGLFHLIVRVFKQIIDTLEYVLFTVDEWLRFRSGEGRVSLVVRTLLGLLWFPVSYFARFYMVVLIEPGINPIKFPISSLAAKFVYPAATGLIPLMTDVLSPVMGTILAGSFAFATYWLLPDAFGFFVWEMKENWSLYRANRRAGLRPVVVGPHGETVPQLLRPGFHSGTLPKLYARLRKAERGAAEGAGWSAVSACRHQLEGLEKSLRLFVTRQLLTNLAREPRWKGAGLAVGRVALASNRIQFELLHADHPDRPVWVEFEERAGWLLAGLRDPGWVKDLGPEHLHSLAAALAGLYKLAGVDLVREQLEARLPADVAGYELTPAGLVLWREGRRAEAVTYDPRSPRKQLIPRTAAGTPAPDWPLLDAEELVFARVPLSWDAGRPAAQADDRFARLLAAPASA